MSVDVDVMERSDFPSPISLVIFTVNDRSVCIPSLADIIHSPLLTSTIVLSLFDSQYDWIVSVDVTLNPLFPDVCVDVCNRITLPPLVFLNSLDPTAFTIVSHGLLLPPHDEMDVVEIGFTYNTPSYSDTSGLISHSHVKQCDVV